MSDTLPFSSPGIGAVAKYNPHLWGPEELKAIFVIRHKELAQLTEAIRDALPGQSPQHLLLIGQRGMGKTTLLQRIALQVEEDESLSQDWLPLRFPEEQYTVSTLAELWGNVLGALADALEARSESTHSIDQYLITMDDLPPEQRESDTLALINQWCEENNKRLLLLIDSTDLMFDNLNDNKKSKKDKDAVSLWRLRKTLQHNPNLMWLGGSYQALEASDLYHDAFVDFFRLIELKPLTLKEITQAMQAMARTFGTGRGIKGEAAEKEITRALTERPERLKTLRNLTGGNPRTTVMLFELFAAGGSDQVKDDLARLLDMMTPLYKARLEAMPDQQRKLLAHIMEYWDPISLGKLAKVSGIVNTKISPQLIRMEKEGLIEKSPLPNTSRSGYQASERFFNIWYLMRNAPRRLKLRLAWLVEFMRMWYEPAELESIARQRIGQYGNRHSRLDDLEYSRAIASAMPCENQTRMALDYQTFQELKKQRQQLDEYFDFDGEDKPFESAHQYEERFEALRERLMQLPFEETVEDRTAFCESLLTSLEYSMDQKEQMLDKLQQEEEEYRKLKSNLSFEFRSYDKEDVRKFRNGVLAQHIYTDLAAQSIALLQLTTLQDEAPSFFWIMAKRFWVKFADEKVDESIVKGLAKNASNINLNNWADFEFLMVARYALPDVSQAFEPWIQKCLATCNAGVIHNFGNLLCVDLNLFEEAERAYKRSIELDSNYAYPWNGLGDLYRDHFNRYDDAERAYQKAIELNADDISANLNLARLYATQNKFKQANFRFRKVLSLDLKETHQTALQSNLWLNNTDSASEPLTALAKAASQGDNLLFFRIKEQCWECQQIGRGMALAELMATNTFAEFLKPFELALRKVNGDDEMIKGASVEIRQLAEEVVVEIEKRVG